MKKLLLFICSVALFSCGGVKKTQQALNSGNYNAVMNNAIDNLSKNKTKKGNQEYVLLLEEAFKKNLQRELEEITFYRKDGNRANLQSIYESYLRLDRTQERIKPLLPLPVYDENRNAKFNFQNFDTKILKAKNELSAYLFEHANDLMNAATTKFDFRQAYDDLSYLEEINPGMYDTKELMQEAHQKGIDFVAVKVTNDTEQIIPKRLEEELLDFNTYGVDNFWTEYHTKPDQKIKYDYALSLDFKQINVSPEQVQEKQLVKEKVVKDGFEYVLDDNGNVAKDSLGNDIKVDKFKTVTCNFYRFTQLKTAQIGAKVTFVDLETQQEINSYPLSSEFVFEHVYATYRGDKRALETDLIGLLDLAAVQFPSNEQMVYDAGEDLKGRLSQIVRSHGFN